MQRHRGQQIFTLEQYLDEARRLVLQGEHIEAIWCYETILRDPRIAQHPPVHQAAALGLGQLLMDEARASDDARRSERLLARAISALSAVTPPTASLGLALAEAHVRRFHLLRLQQDLLAGNIHLDRLDVLAQDDSPLAQKIAPLRARLIQLRDDGGPRN